MEEGDNWCERPLGLTCDEVFAGLEAGEEVPDKLLLQLFCPLELMLLLDKIKGGAVGIKPDIDTTGGQFGEDDRRGFKLIP